jgi:hypothetical protein
MLDLICPYVVCVFVLTALYTPSAHLASGRGGLVKYYYIGVFKTPVIIANTGYRKGLSRKLGCGKPAAFFLQVKHVLTSHEPWR